MASPAVSGLKLTFIMTGLCLAVLLTGMDQTILATAAPTISDEFDALDDIAWWTNLYLLMLSSFQLFYGKLYTLFSIKLIYIGAIGLFEIGSLICTTAPNSTALIFGRAIAGLGASGIFSGGVLITTKVIPLSRRPAYLGIMSAVFGVAAIAGPFIGGALTDQSTWRWCFGINLPIGACTIIICVFLVQIPPEPAVRSLSWKAKIQEFDIPGTFLLVSGLICLLLGLQWGGGIYAWSSGQVIAFLTLSGVLLSAFAVLQASHRFVKSKTIPTTISKDRDIWLAASYAMGLTGGIYVLMVYLPLWFQVVRGKTALSSGVFLTPTIGAYVVGSVIAGGATSATGYYNPGMILGTILLITGAAVLTTLEPNISTHKVIGYELLYGFGAGFGFGQPSYVVQTLLPESDVPIGVTFITLVQNLSASIFVAVGQSIFQNGLVHRLSSIAPETNSSKFLQTGARNLLSSLPPKDRPRALEVFSDALVRTFYISLAVSCTTIFGALGVRWQSMKSTKALENRNNIPPEDTPPMEEVSTEKGT
ncbi:MFS general substrate transporter [Lindgomyces ingoldianus]|uniref:MFS general substrate transporter n=1 Tax=Lindgomyces ingoldianus TaxID=673940 RepID=A0ACB6QDC8_9PLEO|nr:MFS general substrate transporter [Lindgomyces ingoldianus]KAF2464151.1 MFS general substrate transporter [Lindgomyces ingoldianus]